MHGTVRIAASGNGRCRRTDNFTVEAKIFGLGGLIESSIEKELQSARAKEYAFLTRWFLAVRYRLRERRVGKTALPKVRCSEECPWIVAFGVGPPRV